MKQLTTSIFALFLKFNVTERTLKNSPVAEFVPRCYEDIELIFLMFTEYYLNVGEAHVYRYQA